jgi:hypothetical protein
MASIMATDDSPRDVNATVKVLVPGRGVTVGATVPAEVGAAVGAAVGTGDGVAAAVQAVATSAAEIARLTAGWVNRMRMY